MAAGFKTMLLAKQANSQVGRQGGFLEGAICRYGICAGLLSAQAAEEIQCRFSLLVCLVLDAR
jgi:hypothetical protein